MRKHYEYGYLGSERRGYACAFNAHIERKHKKVIAEDIEDAAYDDGCGGKSGVRIVAQERRENPGEYIYRDGEQRRAQISAAKRQQKIICAEQTKQAG